MTKSLRSKPIACPTLPASRRHDVEIPADVGMALGTMGFTGVIDSCVVIPSSPPPDVLAVSNGLHVGGIHTTSVGAIKSATTTHIGIMAGVVGLQSLGYGRDETLVGPSVGKRCPASTIEFAANPEYPVATRETVGCPLPTPIIEHMDLRPKPSGQTGIAEGGGGKIGLHREPTPLGVTQPVVYRHAAASIIQVLGYR